MPRASAAMFLTDLPLLTPATDRPTRFLFFFFLFARFRGILWKAARIGERLSPWVGLVCLAAGIGVLLR